jgi:ABC-type nickel/cobalt efflux system permease component RcnA
MLRILRKFKAQSVGKYTIMISIVILAIVGMTYFVQRLFSARINDARGYMLRTLNPDIKEIHEARTGISSGRILAEYEPYYQHKVSDMAPSSQENILINGQAGTYIYRRQSLTLMNRLSTENPAQHDDYPLAGSTSDAEIIVDGGGGD